MNSEKINANEFPLPKEPYQFLFGTVYPLFGSSLSIGLIKNKDVIGIWGNGNIIYHYVNGYVTAYGPKSYVENANKEGNKLLKEDIFKTHKKNLNNLSKKRQEFINYLHNTDLSNLPNQKLANLTQTFSDLYSRMLAYFVISRPEYVDHLSKELLEEITKEELDEKIRDNDFLALTFPTEIDIIKKEHKARLELLKNPTGENLKNHIMSNPWLYWTEYKLEKAIEQLKETIKDESLEVLEKEIKKEKSELEEKRRKKEETLKKYKSEKVHLLSDRVAWFGHNRLEVKSLFAGFELVCHLLFEEIERRTDISVHEIMTNYITNDLKPLILERKKLSIQDVKERKNTVFFTHNDKIHKIHGEKAKEFAQHYLAEHFNLEGITEVRGTIAYKGKVTGKCRIIRLGEDHDLSAFQEGEILLSEMTQPRMVPIMKKCKAIVTDEGGLASHAAIISRELGVPCIVGTHKATRIFKNGDIIEVDADKGIVRKIE